MAIVRKSLEQIIAEGGGYHDDARLAATTEEEIRRQAEEDGDDPDDVAGYEPMILPQVVRKRLGMTQEEFATALRVPLATLRNWEQGRVRPDPAARSLLLIVAREPERALAALAAA